MKSIKLKVLVIILHCFIYPIHAQTGINGKIKLDSSIWSSVAYLAHIPDFRQMNTISSNYIVEKTNISQDGKFYFSTEFLPEQEKLYRIHFSKKGDHPYSLTIGGKEHNHLFLFAQKNSEIYIQIDSGKSLINKIFFNCNKTGNAMNYINSLLNLRDSLEYYGNSLNSVYINSVINNQLREFADTCSSSLVSLYAIYQSDYLEYKKINTKYYKNFLRKWKSEKSIYFKEFKKEIGFNNHYQKIFLLFIVLIFLIMAYQYYRKKHIQYKNVLKELTIQERNILSKIKEGKSNKEIAEDLAVSLSTVKTHINNIYTKLGIKSRKQIFDL